MGISKIISVRYLSIVLLGLSLISGDALSVPIWLQRLLCCCYPRDQVERVEAGTPEPDGEDLETDVTLANVVRWVEMGDQDQLRVWFDQGGDPRTLDGTHFQRTLLHHARTVEMATFLVAVEDVPLDQGDVNGLTPLAHAVINNQRELALLFIGQGANPDRQDLRGHPILNEEQMGLLREWQRQALPGAVDEARADEEVPAPLLPRQRGATEGRLGRHHNHRHARYRRRSMLIPTLAPIEGSLPTLLTGASAEAPF